MTSAIFIGLISHNVESCLRAVDSAFGVYVEGEIDLGGLNIGNEIRPQNAGDVHHRINPGPELRGGQHGLFPLRGIANIELADVELRGRSGRSAELFHGRGVDVAGHDGVAASEQRAGQRKSKSAGSAGNQVMFHAKDDNREPQVRRRFPVMSADRKGLVDARAAIADQGEEDREHGGQNDSPANAASPDPKHGNKAFLYLVLIDSCIGVCHGIWPPLRWQRYE